VRNRNIFEINYGFLAMLGWSSAVGDR